MLWQTFWIERSWAVWTLLQSLNVVIFKRSFIICLEIVSSRFSPSHGLLKVFRRLGAESSLIERFLFLFNVPFLLAYFQVNLKTLSPVFSSTDVTYKTFWSLNYVRWYFFLLHLKSCFSILTSNSTSFHVPW